MNRQLGSAADLARGHPIHPMLDQLEDRAVELEADNHALRRRLAQLETEHPKQSQGIVIAMNGPSCRMRAH